MTGEIICLRHRDLTEDQALAIGTLMASTWENPEKDAAHRAASLIKLGAGTCDRDDLASRSFVIFDGSQCIAHAAMQPRLIDTTAGDLWVLGLGAVCADASRRREGLGARIVKAAFAMIDEGLAPFSLFQTTFAVQPFYEKLGACVVTNRVVDSTADDPEENPFWDNVVMRYPSRGDWPDGTIDLRGQGY